jgi:hypothetical protein
MTPANGDGVPPGDGGRRQDHNHSEGLCDSYADMVRNRINSLTMRERIDANLMSFGTAQRVAYRTQRAYFPYRHQHQHGRCRHTQRRNRPVPEG